MSFKDILFIYNMKMNNARIKLDRELITYDEFNLIRDEALYWLTHLKDMMNMDDWCLVRRPTPEEVERYKDPIEIMEYRDDIIPIYNDDYGQSMYAFIFGKEYGGGTYNFQPYFDFSNIYDSERANNYR